MTCFTIQAQKTKVKDLALSAGHWEGTLTYLDYSTAKPYTMAAKLQVALTKDKKGYIMNFAYPKEPHANALDTTYIQNNFFGNESIISFSQQGKKGFDLITEKEGEDGNEHQKAQIRHRYCYTGKSFKIIKEVKFLGTDRWIKRNEYAFER